jgi:hypothetical protein
MTRCINPQWQNIRLSVKREKKMNISTVKSGKRLTMVISALLFSVLMSSCGTSKLVATWHDEAFAGRQIVQDVLIIAVTKDETIRRLYEDEFVEVLSKNGVRAVASYTLSRPDIKPTEEDVDAAVKEAGAQAVLITRYLGTDTKEHYRPPQRTMIYADPYYRGIHGYYPMAYQEVYSPGYTVKVTTISLESNLYDTGTGNLVWSTRSESINPAMTKKYVTELVKLFAGDLKKANLM